MPFDFANCRFYNELSLVDLLSVKKNNLENINNYGNSRIDKIKDFFSSKDGNKILADFWLTIKKKDIIQEKTQYNRFT